MAQATLSDVNAIQQRTGVEPASGSGSGSATCEVYLPAGTQAGNTVTVEMFGPSVYPNMPAGWEYDATAGGDRMWCFRKPNVAADEGVQGSTGWIWDATPIPYYWNYRVTEWDTALEPVSPLEAHEYNIVTGVVSAHSTGTTWTTSRPNVVALAMHFWQPPIGSTPTFNWSDHTNGFTERDELRYSPGTNVQDISWSWMFATATGAFETTATANAGATDVNDVLRGLIVVYAATTYA